MRAHKLDASDPSVFLRTSAFLLGALVVSSTAQAIAPEQLKAMSPASANATVCRTTVAEAVRIRKKKHIETTHMEKTETFTYIECGSLSFIDFH
jgi:hypothetical protein